MRYTSVYIEILYSILVITVFCNTNYFDTLKQTYSSNSKYIEFFAQCAHLLAE